MTMEAIEMSPTLARGAVPSVAVVVDALPYIDMGYDEPGVREAVSKLFYFWVSKPSMGHRVPKYTWITGSLSVPVVGSLRLDIPNEIAETSEETNVGFAASKCDKVATRFTSGWCLLNIYNIWCNKQWMHCRYWIDTGKKCDTSEYTKAWYKCSVS